MVFICLPPFSPGYDLVRTSTSEALPTVPPPGAPQNGPPSCSVGSECPITCGRLRPVVERRVDPGVGIPRSPRDDDPPEISSLKWSSRQALSPNSLEGLNFGTGPQPLIIHHSSCTTHHTPLIIHHSSVHHSSMHHSSIHHSSIHHSSIHHSSYTTHHTPLIMHHP